MQGRVDIPLNETGRAQARCAARRLKSISFDAVYSSPLGRAVETAQIVTGLPTQEINIEPRAIELGFGVWDNRLHAELEKETEQFDILWDETDKYVPPQGAEPLEDLMTRVHAMLQELAARHAGGRILVTTHGGVQQAVFTIVERRPLPRYVEGFPWELRLRGGRRTRGCHACASRIPGCAAIKRVKWRVRGAGL